MEHDLHHADGRADAASGLVFCTPNANANDLEPVTTRAAAGSTMRVEPDEPAFAIPERVVHIVGRLHGLRGSEIQTLFLAVMAINQTVPA